MTVRAPFRFAPISDQVYFPKWGPLVSHDVPFKDGLSGEVAIEIEARTPLLVGGGRRAAQTRLEAPPNGQEGEVWPFTAPDGTYAIPGSAIQGMVRSVMEVATLGRLGQFVYDRRFGFRDLRSRTGRRFYQDRMATNSGGTVTQHAQAGWLVMGPTSTHNNPDPKIIPCSYARITFAELRSLKGGGGPDPLEQRNEAPARYDWFIGGAASKATLDRTVYLGPSIPNPHVNGTIQIHYQRGFATAASGRVATPGTVVFTGKPQGGTGPRAKKLEFVLHTPNRMGAALSPTALDVDAGVWRDFNLIHSEQPGRPANPNWSYWRDEFNAGRPVPIFYLEDRGTVMTFGTAFMFKTALELSTHEMLSNSAPDHIAEPDDCRLDLPSLIFGVVADDLGERGLKRRASFDLARVTALPTSDLHVVGRAILLDPKPAYFPSYVSQPGDRTSGRLDDNNLAFATYSADTKAGKPERKKPELAGVKVWPARNRVSGQVRPPHLENQRGIQITLNALPCCTRFETTLRFHNLRPAELGAVLWALSFGDRDAWTSDQSVKLRHRLGMGKPYGLGEVAIRILSGTLIAERNNGDGKVLSVADMVKDFETEMGNAVANWRNLPQLRTLFAAADPRIGAARPPTSLEYMVLDPGHNDEFTTAKTDGTFLPEYMTDEAVLAARVGARIRMTVGPPAEGTIVGVPDNPALPWAEWLIHLDNRRDPIRYVRQRFEVIG